MTVDELVSGWTDQEKEDLKDLIEECRKRERQVAENRKASLEGIKNIKGNIDNLMVEFTDIRRLMDEILGDLADCLYSGKRCSWRC